MRLCEIERANIYRTKKTIPLKLIHKWKCRKKKLHDFNAKRAPLLAAMYGQGDSHENAFTIPITNFMLLNLWISRARKNTMPYSLNDQRPVKRRD